MDGTDISILLALVAGVAMLVHVVRSTRGADIAAWRKVFTAIAAPIGVALIVLVIVGALTG